MNQMNKDKKFILEITEEDYKKGLDKGWTEDDMLPVGKHEFRRATRFSNKEIKIKLQADIIDFLRNRSEESIEKQINEELHKIMEKDKLKAA